MQIQFDTVVNFNFALLKSCGYIYEHCSWWFNFTDFDFMKHFRAILYTCIMIQVFLISPDHEHNKIKSKVNFCLFIVLMR